VVFGHPRDSSIPEAEGNGGVSNGMGSEMGSVLAFSHFFLFHLSGWHTRLAWLDRFDSSIPVRCTTSWPAATAARSCSRPTRTENPSFTGLVRFVPVTAG